MSTIVTITLNPALDIATDTPSVEPTIKLRCSAPVVQAGGGGINVARVASRFGVPATALIMVGGASGTRLTDLLHAEGLAHVAVPIAGDTRESVTVTEAETGEQYRFVMPGPMVDAAEWDGLLAALGDVDPIPSAIVLSGSHPPGLEPGTVNALAQAVCDRGIPLIVDGPDVVLAGTHGAFLIKPNERELGLLVGRKLRANEEIAAAARAVIADGTAKNVLVSMGPEGALLVTAETVSFYRAPPMKVVSAVGAGDSMVGALVASLAKGLALKDAVARGVAAGSAAVVTPGTDLCWPGETERLLPRVTRSDLQSERAT